MGSAAVCGMPDHRDALEKQRRIEEQRCPSLLENFQNVKPGELPSVCYGRERERRAQCYNCRGTAAAALQNLILATYQ